MITVNQAESIILDLVQPLDVHQDVEIVDLLTARSRILAIPITSNLDFPHWDNSAMDGYAVKFADVQDCSAQQPASLTIVAEIQAGVNPQITLKSGQAARIFTGAMIPEGADTVIMQEVTHRQGNHVEICAPPSQLGAFVRPQGSFYQAGTPLLSPGIILQAPEIALLAATQQTKISVYRCPRVTIFSTGNELVAPTQPLSPGKIIDSNQYALATALAALNAKVQMLGIIEDNRESLTKAIAASTSTADIIISTGGVSVGDYDYIQEILKTLGAKIEITAVAVKPGKPLKVATFRSPTADRQILYFGLPGNPVSTLVTFWRFVQPAIKKLTGLASGWKPIFVKARSLSHLASDSKKETYYWGHLHLVDGEYEFHLAPGSQNSGNLLSITQINGLGVMEMGQTAIAPGDFIRVLPIN